MSCGVMKSSMPRSCVLNDDLGTALVAKLRANAGQFLDDDLGDALGPRQNVHQVGDLFEQLGEIGDDLVALKSGQRCRRSSRIACACASESR
jgi:hypothetical protein